MKTATLVLLALFIASPVEAEQQKLRHYFSEHKVGDSADYGIFKRNTDYVITVHGFNKDLDICLEIVKMLNKDQPNTYSCKPLNH